MAANNQGTQTRVGSGKSFLLGEVGTGGLKMCGSSPAGEVGEAGGGWGQKGDLSRALNGVGDT